MFLKKKNPDTSGMCGHSFGRSLSILCVARRALAQSSLFLCMLYLQSKFNRQTGTKDLQSFSLFCQDQDEARTRSKAGYNPHTVGDRRENSTTGAARAAKVR